MWSSESRVAVTSQPGDSASAPAKPAKDINVYKDVYMQNPGLLPKGGVSGWYAFRVSPRGSYNYSGRLHETGLFTTDRAGYEVVGVCVVRFADGTAFHFSKHGRVYGGAEAGSRDYNWNNGGYNRAIRDAWKASGGVWRTSCSVGVNSTVYSQLKRALQVVGYASKVIEVVA
jgi:hypothetical protein